MKWERSKRRESVRPIRVGVKYTIQIDLARRFPIACHLVVVEGTNISLSIYELDSRATTDLMRGKI